MADAPHRDRLIAAAIRAYPDDFRAEYGDELRIVAADVIRDARSRGAVATAATRLRIVAGMIAGAMGEHTRKESAMRITASGLGAGLAISAGLTVLYFSFSSPGFWGLVGDVGPRVGIDTTSPWFHPTIVMICSALVTIGLLAAVARITDVTRKTRTWLRALVIAAGAALVLAGATMAGQGLPRSTGLSWSWIRESLVTASAVLGGVAFLLLLAALIAIGVATVATRALGPLSIAPLLCAGAVVLITVMGLIGGSATDFVAYAVFAREAPMIIATWIVAITAVLFGAAVALTPAGRDARHDREHRTNGYEAKQHRSVATT